MDGFKRANVKSMLSFEKNAKEELLKSNHAEQAMRHRRNRDKDSMANMSSEVTDQLISISRQLAETTERSAKTLETLVISSDSVTGTQEELKVTSGTINQSGKLLAKYGRREFTDKILLFFAFAFFIVCVIYIVKKRFFYL